MNLIIVKIKNYTNLKKNTKQLKSTLLKKKRLHLFFNQNKSNIFAVRLNKKNKQSFIN
jgi:hypothetical protein